MKTLLFVTLFLITACDISIPGPTPLPSPSPSSSSTPSPTVQPTATPTPSPSPIYSCNLPEMRECGGPEIVPGVFGCCDCRTPPNTFEDAVETAIANLQIQKPELFNGEKVLDEDAYMKGVEKNLKKAGFCAKRGGPLDEVGVKVNNNFSMQYDVLTGDLYIRHRAPQCVCTPARF